MRGGVVNELPPFNTYLWNTYGNAYINEKGNLVIPDLKSSANVILKWPRKTKAYMLIAQLEEGITSGRFYVTYLDKDFKSLTSENVSRKNLTDGVLYYTFGGENFYGETIYASEYVKIQFEADEKLAPPPIEIKKVEIIQK